MKKLLLAIALLGALAPLVARADEPKTELGPAVAALARVTPFIAGLKEPQGLALDDNGDVIVCDYGAGEVLRFDKMGAKKEVLASGLKGPSQIAGQQRISRDKDNFVIHEQARDWLVSERKANRVVLLRDDKIVPIGEAIEEPMGLFHNWNLIDPVTYVVAHTTSRIYRLSKTRRAGQNTQSWSLFYEAPTDNGNEGRYGLRCLAADGDTLFVSDEVNGDILMLSRGGRMGTFASGIEDPSGLSVRRGWVYVCDEGNGGRLWKVDRNGKKTLAAEKLGRPRNLLFLDDQTALVSDRDGRVLKLNWTP